jgi:hypothetical protein
LLAASRSRQQALLIKPHGLLDYESQHGTTGQASDATGIEPCHLLWCELDGKRM